MKLMLSNVRLAFPTLFEAKTVGGEGEPAFSASFLFDAKHPANKQLNDAIEAVAKEKWGAKAEAQLKALRSSGKVCLKDGDEKANYEGFEGNFFVSARSKSRPLVLDRDKSPLSQADGKPYAGCYVNASIEIYAQDNGFGKRINASLRGVQFVKDGDSFGGGGAASADEFDSVSEGVDADSLV